MSRKRRGMRTQALLAQRWQQSGLFPFATDAGAGRAGRDILNTPGLCVEVKAKGRLTLLETMRKAESYANEGELPIVVWRHNGQGELSIDQWSVSMRLADFEELWIRAHGGGKHGGLVVDGRTVDHP